MHKIQKLLVAHDKDCITRDQTNTTQKKQSKNNKNNMYTFLIVDDLFFLPTCSQESSSMLLPTPFPFSLVSGVTSPDPLPVVVASFFKSTNSS